MRLVSRFQDGFGLGLVVLLLVSSSILTFGCDRKTDSKPDKIVLSENKRGAFKQQECPWMHEKELVKGEGVVVAYTNAGPYTIMKIKCNNSTVWLATLQVIVKKGDIIAYQNGHIMYDFYSKSLHKTFKKIVLSNSVTINGKKVLSSHDNMMMGMKMKNPHSASLLGKESVLVKPGMIKKVKGGYTIAQIFDQKKELANKIVKVRGKVVKIFSGIMGKNWIHIQDGTGSKSQREIIVTSSDMVHEGDIIVAQGKLVLNKSLGKSHFFPLLIENAKIVIE
ncbi:MAG: hypothetical protein Q9M37_07580 [Desulfonauticus sp.]|nr:hypothetical protein [Desulfonauticus sp.]